MRYFFMWSVAIHDKNDSALRLYMPQRRPAFGSLVLLMGEKYRCKIHTYTRTHTGTLCAMATTKWQLLNRQCVDIFPGFPSRPYGANHVHHCVRHTQMWTEKEFALGTGHHVLTSQQHRKSERQIPNKFGGIWKKRKVFGISFRFNYYLNSFVGQESFEL